MVVSGGVRWCAALGVLGLTVGAWAQPAGVRGSTQLAPKVHDYYAECRNPDTELCTVQSPDSSLYMYTVLTPDISFDDLGAHWVVDLRKFPAAKGAIKVLRVATSTGEVHAIRLKLVYEATPTRSNAAAKVLTVPPEAKPAPGSMLPTAPPPQSNVSMTGKPPSTVMPVSAKQASPSGTVPPALPASRGTEAKQPERSTKPTTLTSDVTASAEVPCLDGICLGASIQTLKAPFEPVFTVEQQLRAGLQVNAHRFPDLDKRVKQLGALFKQGDMEGSAQAGEDWLKASSKERQLQTNLFHLKQAYELAQKALGGKRNADTAALALYFMPQPPPKALKDGPGISGALNVGADPLLFAVRTELQFDAGLAPLIKKAKPVFCGVFQLQGHFTSPSGYGTTVTVRSDADGDFKVANVRRVFTADSHDSLKQLAQQLTQRYDLAIKAQVASIDLRSQSMSLELRHPLAVQLVGAPQKLVQQRDALWQQGWLDFKGKELGVIKAMQALASYQQASIPVCKPKALPLS
nr:hypothetical protein [uncultured Comamonas sp.]